MAVFLCVGEMMPRLVSDKDTSGQHSRADPGGKELSTATTACILVLHPQQLLTIAFRFFSPHGYGVRFGYGVIHSK